MATILSGIGKNFSCYIYSKKQQLDGSTPKVHAQHLRLANVDDWQLPYEKGKLKRPTRYVVPPISSSSHSSSSESSDSEMINDPMSQRLCRRERNNSSSEDDIPLQELRDRIRARKARDSYNAV